MNTLTILVIAVLAVVALAGAFHLAVRSDGYGRRARPPSSRWPDAFDPPPWHVPEL
jgi:hypothetical protein